MNCNYRPLAFWFSSLLNNLKVLRVLMFSWFLLLLEWEVFSFGHVSLMSPCEEMASLCVIRFQFMYTNHAMNIAWMDSGASCNNSFVNSSCSQWWNIIISFSTSWCWDSKWRLSDRRSLWRHPGMTSIQVCASKIEPRKLSWHHLSLVGAFQEGSMSGEGTSTSGTLSNFHHLPFSCKLELHTRNSLVR